MIQFDASSLDPLAIVLLVVAAVVVNLMASAVADSGWRNSVGKDLDLYAKLMEAAVSDEDREVAETVRKAAFRKTKRGATGPARMGSALFAVFSRFPLTIVMSMVVLVEILLFGRFMEEMMPLVFVPLATDFVLLAMSKRSLKGKDGSSAGGNDGGKG